MVTPLALVALSIVSPWTASHPLVALHSPHCCDISAGNVASKDLGVSAEPLVALVVSLLKGLDLAMVLAAIGVAFWWTISTVRRRHRSKFIGGEIDLFATADDVNGTPTIETRDRVPQSKGNRSNRVIHPAFQIRDDSLLLVMVFYFISVITLAAGVDLLLDRENDVRASLIVNNGSLLAGLAACAWVTNRNVPGGVLRFLFKCESTAGRCTMWGIGVATIALVLCPLVRDATIALLLAVDPHVRFQPHPTIDALHAHSTSPAVVVSLWLGAVAIAPLAEEVFFRGLLQTFLVQASGSYALGIFLASAAFGLVHFQQVQAIAALFVLGLLLGYLYKKTGSLIVCIAVHAAFNLKTLIWNALLPSI